jgi:hypothetical protein
MLLYEQVRHIGYNTLPLIGQHAQQKTTHVDSIRSLKVDQMSGLLGSGLIEDDGQKSMRHASESTLFPGDLSPAAGHFPQIHSR